MAYTIDEIKEAMEIVMVDLDDRDERIEDAIAILRGEIEICTVDYEMLN